MTNKKKRVDFYISGFNCATCTRIVGKALEGLSGITEINVNYVLNKGYIDFDPEQITEDLIVDRLKDRTSLRVVYRKK